MCVFFYIYILPTVSPGGSLRGEGVCIKTLLAAFEHYMREESTEAQEEAMKGKTGLKEVSVGRKGMSLAKGPDHEQRSALHLQGGSQLGQHGSPLFLLPRPHTRTGLQCTAADDVRLHQLDKVINASLKPTSNISSLERSKSLRHLPQRPRWPLGQARGLCV
jgi:hypothetical protein